MAQTHSLDLERGSSQYASIAHGSQTGLDLGNTYTIEAWIKIESLPSSGQSYGIWSKFNGTDEGRPDFFYCNEGGTLRFQVYCNGATARFNYTLLTGVWYHVAFTYTSSGPTSKFYINGNENVPTSGNPNSPAASVDNVWVGRGGLALDGSGGYFDGIIKDVRVFNDVRTQAEIIADAHAEHVSDANLVGEWNFNNAATDASGNSNNLTLQGSPSYTTDRPWEDPSGISGSAFLETNLVSYYTLDEASGTRLDSTSNNNDLSDNNTVAAATGKINDGADFEASNSEYLSIANGSQTGLNITGSYTLSLWIKAETLLGNATVISRWTNSGGNQGYLMQFNATPKMVLQTNGNDTAGATTLSTGVWYHLVGVFDAVAGMHFLYVNGMLDGTEGSISAPSSNSSDFVIGSLSTLLTGFYFDGVVDEVAVYSRALHYGDILDLYQEGAALPYSGSTQYDQTLDASTTATATIAQVKTILQAMTASVSGSASVSMIKNFVRTLGATATATASVLKGLAMTMEATATATADMLAERVYLVTMNALTSATASLTKTVGYVRTLSAGATATASIAKQLALSAVLSASVSVAATITATREVVMNAAVATTATITTVIGKTLTASVSILAKISAPFWRTKYPAHGDGEDYEIKYPHE